MSPRLLLRRVALAEAVTWALLLAGMFLKYVTETSEVGVQVAGPIHGVVFVAYCVTCIVVAIDQRWPIGRLLLALVSSIPPFATVLFDRHAEARGAVGLVWRLRTDVPTRVGERPIAGLVRRPVAGLGVGVAVVVLLTGVALLLGPPS